MPAAAEILNPFEEQERKLVQLAQAIPPEKYGWRPAAGVRSVAEVFAHCALGSKVILDLALDPPEKAALESRIQTQLKNEGQPRSKDEILALMNSSFEQVRKAIAPLRAGSLSRESVFFGTNTTRRGVLIFLDTHLAEHLGQAIAYARMNGIVPPWSEPPRNTVQ